MPRTALTITNGFYKTNSKPVSAQNCVNMFPVIYKRPALVKESLRGTPGVRLVVDTGA